MREKREDRKVPLYFFLLSLIKPICKNMFLFFHDGMAQVALKLFNVELKCVERLKRRKERRDKSTGCV